MNLKMVITLLATIVSGLACAHEEAMDSSWCEGGQIEILGHFQLNHNLLEKFKGEDNAVCSQLKSCGQFDDDDYGVSMRAASALCSSFSESELLLRVNGYHDTVRPIFYSPVNFKNSETNHHILYSLSQGIEFSCARCIMREYEAEDAPVSRQQLR